VFKSPNSICIFLNYCCSSPGDQCRTGKPVLRLTLSEAASTQLLHVQVTLSHVQVTLSHVSAGNERRRLLHINLWLYTMYIIIVIFLLIIFRVCATFICGHQTRRKGNAGAIGVQNTEDYWFGSHFATRLVALHVRINKYFCCPN
jgi:hypothetical protein